MAETYTPTWDLDVLFPGGSDSQEFQDYLQHVKKELNKLSQMVDSFNPEQISENMEAFTQLIDKLEATRKELRDAGAFVSCLSAQDVHDKKATQLVGQMGMISAKMGTVQTHFNQKLIAMDEKTWKEVLNIPEINELAFVLQEKRNRAKDKLSGKEEVLINDLSVDGYSGWGQMYNAIVAGMNVEIEEDGKVNTYSVGQASNKLSSPDRKVRKHVHEQLGKAWKEQEDLFGQTLNHLAGFRLQTYKHRGWNDVLKEPLDINRMSKDTLNAMWGAITEAKQPFVKFLEKKADLLGLDKLNMYDVNAPLTQSVKTSTYTEGAHFIIDHFRGFSPKMADFAKMAFENRWIEAEDRSGKRPGG
ncbi:MAG TPA: oligoendopeptidase, partial [Bacillota bacterium]|nr:oligoendopeptidase [Bacillota bacterium]